MPEAETIALPAEEEKAPNAFKTISEVADTLDVPQHVLRFWESRFPQIKPLKLRGGRRYYRPEDIDTLAIIKTLLYQQGYTIDGAKKAFGKESRTVPAPTAEKPAKPAMNDRQKSQLTVVRHELIALKDRLKPYLQ